MGEISILTPEQKIILDELSINQFLVNQFYFTGGTVLSNFYLQHRYSDDLDFFSESKFDNQVILAIVSEWSKKLNFEFEARFNEVVYIFNFKFKNNVNLKVDFAYYPYKRIEKGSVYKGVTVDSIFDIAINKLLTINQRTDVKDFVDYYYLSKQFTIWDLMIGVETKFRVDNEPFLIASDFLKVEDFKFMPRMIKKLSLVELQKFFREQAKEVGKKAVK